MKRDGLGAIPAVTASTSFSPSERCGRQTAGAQDFNGIPPSLRFLLFQNDFSAVADGRSKAKLNCIERHKKRSSAAPFFSKKKKTKKRLFF